jgi:hypothetical protein
MLMTTLACPNCLIKQSTLFVRGLYETFEQLHPMPSPARGLVKTTVLCDRVEDSTLSPAKPPDDGLDEAWLLARARGEPFEHPDPERAAAYVRLEQALAELPLSKAPEGWKAKVLDAIASAEDSGGQAAGVESTVGAQAETASPSRRDASPPGRASAGRETVARLQSVLWHWLTRGSPWVLAVAAIALLWVYARPHGGDASTEAGELAVNVQPGPLTRGLRSKGGVARGSSLTIRGAPVGGGEIRVYRDRRELVLRCPGDAGCSRAHEGGRDVLRGELTLGSSGSYRVLLLSGANVPPPLGSEDADLAAAAAARVKIRSEATLEVF